MPHGYRQGGWKDNKFFIAKNTEKGIEWANSEAKYFVLRFDKDPHARVALSAYRISIRDENPEFARDIGQQLTKSLTSEGATLQLEMRMKAAGYDTEPEE